MPRNFAGHNRNQRFDLLAKLRKLPVGDAVLVADDFRHYILTVKFYLRF